MGFATAGSSTSRRSALAEPAAAQAAAEKAEAIAVFYGAPGVSLGAALQKLAPGVRARGGRVVAVLQREQAAQRDDCFRAGASDLLFMPMPKDQFVARLEGSVALSWASEGGAPAAVAVATRSAASKIDGAKVSPLGVEAAGDLPVQAGETVRLSWGSFQHWGLVVRGGPGAQIRFAGLAPDEEAQIRDWLKAEASKPPPAPAAQPPAPPAAPPPPPPEAETAAAPAPPPPPAEPEAPPPAAGARAAPAAGPPPGFANRKPIRPHARTPNRVPPPVMAAGGAAPSVPAAPPPAPSAPAGPASAAPAASPAAPAAAVPPPPPQNGADALANLFDERAVAPAAAAEGAVAAPAAAPAGPPWPVPVPLAACKAAALQFLKDKTTPADAPPALAASARKLTGMLGSSERTALDKAGSDSHFAETLATRIALDTATAEAMKLFASTPAPSFDAAAAASLTKAADDATARLQKEANTAIGKGEVENLQLLTAASAALSRDLLSFKETADRLRGISAAPRLGAGALDPNVVLPGQAPRPRQQAASSAPAPVRAELRDFQGLEQGTGRAKNWVAALLIIGAVVAAVNGFYFGLPHHNEVSASTAGEGVIRIDVSGESAMVTVSPDWAAHWNARLMQLDNVLKETGAKKAIVLLPSGKTGGASDRGEWSADGAESGAAALIRTPGSRTDSRSSTAHLRRCDRCRSSSR